MLKKIGLVAVLAALVSVVVATTAWGSAKPRTLAATASVSCGKSVKIGVAYPATGGVAGGISLGSVSGTTSGSGRKSTILNPSGFQRRVLRSTGGSAYAYWMVAIQ